MCIPTLSPPTQWHLTKRKKKALAAKLSVASGDSLHNNSYPRIVCHLTGSRRTSDMGPPVSWHIIGSSGLPSWTTFMGQRLCFVMLSTKVQCMKYTYKICSGPSPAVDRWRGIQWSLESQSGPGGTGKEWHLAPGLSTAAPAIPAVLKQLTYWSISGNGSGRRNSWGAQWGMSMPFNFFEVIEVDQEAWFKPGFELLWICRTRLWIEFGLFFTAFCVLQWLVQHTT